MHMRVHTSTGVLLAVISALMIACSPAASTGPTSSGLPTQATKKKLTASIFSDPAGFHQQLTNRVVGSVSGLAELNQLMHSGLTYRDDRDVLRPRLAEAVPSVENGLWKIAADGKMETTWRLRPNLRWHDGQPFTASDLAFSIRFNKDKEIGIQNLAFMDLIEGAQALDPVTIVVRWSQPFIEADNLFSPDIVLVIPEHIMAKTYADDKASVLNAPFWREEYVGAGPYRLQQWSPGSYVILDANDAYVEGRPKIDQIEVRFITAIAAVSANLLAGATNIHLGRGYGVEQLLDLKNTSQNLNIAVGTGLLSDAIPMFPQFVNTDPPIVLNPAFRRALLEAIDRQEMTDTINYGLGPVAHTWLQPDRAEYPGVESKIAKYNFDPRHAAQVIESLGFAKGSDGIFRDEGGQKLHINLRTTDQRLIQPRSAFSVADYWKRLGLDIEVTNVPNQLIPDREYRTQFPAFELVAGGVGPASNQVQNWLGRMSPTPETRFVGGNRSRYRNAELDSFIEKYVVTVPISERLSALGDVIRHQSEHLTIMTLFYEGSVVLLGDKKLKGVTSNRVWNVQDWDLTN